MKKLLFILLVVNCHTGTAQVVIEENPSYTNSTEKPVLDELLNIDVLDGASTAQQITPTGQKLCFDKVFKITSNSLKGEITVCMFINTKIGLIAYITPKQASAGRACIIDANDPDFTFNVIGLKGNLYTYYNVKKPTGIEKWFSTGNSETYVYQNLGTTQEQVLFKKDESREYLDGKVKAWAYAVPDRPETWFLFGKNLPVKLVMQPLKYLGNFGVGFQYTEYGTFIIMQVTGEIINSTVKELKDTYLCFDPSPYKKIEDEMYTKGMAQIDKKKEKLRRRLGSPHTGPCADLEIRNIQYQITTLETQEENLKRSVIGNVAQSIPTQQAMAQATLNYDDIMQQTIYDTELEICSKRRQLQEAENAQRSELFPNEESKRRLRELIKCLEELNTEQIKTKDKMKQVNTQYPNSPGRQQVEKGKLYLQQRLGCKS